MQDDWSKFYNSVRPLKDKTPQESKPRPDKVTFASGETTQSITSPSNTKSTPTIETPLSFSLSKKRVKLSPFQRKLDLHNLKYESAFLATQAFIKEAFLLKLEAVCIVTGKGFQGQGVLKRDFPEWLKNSSIAPFITVATPILEKNGDFGSYHIKIKKHTAES